MTHPRRASFVVAGLCVAFVIATGPVLAGSGWLDPTFGTRGVARVHSPSSAFHDEADHLRVRVGPTGRIFIFEDLSTHADDESSSGFLRVRTSKGANAASFADGKPLLVGRSGDSHYNRGIFPLPKGGVVYVTMIQDFEYSPRIRVVQRAADGHVVRSTAALPGKGMGMADGLSDVTRLPGGSLRTCGPVEFPAERRLLGLTPTLEPDLRLGPSGYRTLAIGSCGGVTSDALGQIYVAGASVVSGQHALEIIALTSSGEPITSWGNGGHVVIDLGGMSFTSIKGQFVALADGSLLLATEEYAGSPGDTIAMVVRITPDGALDSAFSGDGIATFAPDGGRSKVFAMDADSSGRPILSLAYYLPDGSIHAMIARVTMTGVPDATFGNGGTVTVSRAPRDLDLDSHDDIVSVVADGADLLLTRRN
jgi:uncharacterized delta-60 repeat protein